MANKKILGRVQHKTDTSANWALAQSFIPLKGEVIVYSDLNKIKIGDGTTTVVNLPFAKAVPDKSVNTSTLLAADWVNNTYSFESLYPATNFNIEVELANTATTAQYKAYGKAGLTGNTNTNILTALGTIPTIDIPIIITVEAK